MTVATRITLYIAVTYAFTWACQIPGMLELRHGQRPSGLLIALFAIAACGPTLVAGAFAWLERGRRGLGELLRPKSTRSLGLGLCLFALSFPALAHIAGNGILASCGVHVPQWLYPPNSSDAVLIAIIAPLGEEYGWRGYVLPRMQRLLHPATASLCIGALWSVWHWPSWYVPKPDAFVPLTIALFTIAMMASSVVYTWLFNRSGGALLGPLLAHLGAHLDNLFRASQDGPTTLVITCAMLTLLAAVLVASGQLGRASAVVAPGEPHPLSEPALRVTRA